MSVMTHLVISVMSSAVLNVRAADMVLLTGVHNVDMLILWQGFSSGLYAFFRDPLGEPYTPRSPSTGKPDFNTEYGNDFNSFFVHLTI